MGKTILGILFAATILVSSVTIFEFADASHTGGTKCSLSNSVSTSSVRYGDDGAPRNNPDGTYYPGDAFHYIFKYSASSDCRDFRVHPLQVNGGLSSGSHMLENSSSASLFDLSVANSCKSNKERSGCLGGHAEISTSPTGNESISLTVSAKKRVCNSDGCRWVTISKTATFVPQIITPQITATITKEVVKDSDGYVARNLDGSYYVWDPINILHRPEFLWQNERVGTLHTKVTKAFDVNLEKEFECEQSSCNYTLEHSGLTPSDWPMEHTDGLTLYNATSTDDIRLQNFGYVIELLNIERFLTSVTNSTDALVVRYDPEYDVYPYPVMTDEHKHAFDDRMGLALHYFGSNGGGRDDVDALHEDRRSKINDFHHYGVAFDPWLPVNLDGNTLYWSEALEVGVIQNNSPVQKELQFENIVESDKKFHERTPFVVLENKTAMFEKSGYGKIFFEYPGLTETVFDHENLTPRYENVTSFTTLKSTDFAGAETTFLTFAEYLYPETFFNTEFVIDTIPSDQSIPVSVEIKPQYHSGAASFVGYVDEKINYDSGDDGLAKIIVDDTHVMQEMFSSDNGGVLSFTIKRIASMFDTFWFGQNNNDGDSHGNNGKIKQLYLESINQQRLDTEFPVGLSAPSSMDITITANGITNVIDGKYFDFSQEHSHTINVSQDNVLDVTRNNGSITVKTDDSFGDIVKIQINGGEIQDILCVAKCSISVNKYDALEIKAWNTWNGMSSFYLPEIEEDSLPKVSPPDDFLILYSIVVVPLAYIGYRKLKNRS